MKRFLENALLNSDLDFDGFNLLNPGEFNPPPANLAGSDDTRLNDERFMLDDSVTNASVAENAGIAQSKLDLSGDLPSNFLGHTENHGAPGNEVERIVQRGAISGYCPLDAGGRIDNINYPVTGVGTVASVRLSFPVEFLVDPEVVTSGAKTFVVNWAAAPPLSWFGGRIDHPEILSLVNPGFNTSPFPVALIPNLAATKITSGVFNLSRLPIAIGVGASHASGMVPDPGETGEPSDYLARSMQYRRMTATNAYQNTVPDPSIVFMYYQDEEAAISITDQLDGASLFYRVDHAPQFSPYPDEPVLVDQGSLVEAYAAKIGYTTSDFAALVIPHRRP